MGVYKLSTAGGLATPRTNYSSFLAGNPTFISTSYESIQTVTVGAGGASDVTFSSISQDYKHLQLRLLVRASNSDATGLYFFNSDTTESNYYSHFLVGDGSAANAYAYNNPYSWVYPNASNIFGAAVIDILDYSNTNKYTTIRTLRGNDTNGAGSISLESGLWKNTAAITTIKFNLSSPNNLAQYSQLALYGIKG